MEKSYITLEEIRQQPDMWADTMQRIEDRWAEISDFISGIKQKHGSVKVVFTGAGTSNYVGDVIYPYLRSTGSHGFCYESIPTTDIVSSPYEYVQNQPTVLVSFARSGNSPESVAAVALYEQLVDDLYQVVITCASEGKLAVHAGEKKNTLPVLLNEKTNDRGFAMTSSFSSMTLAALLIFDDRQMDEKKAYVSELIKMGEFVNSKEGEIKGLTDDDFKRVVYLGSGVLGKLTREAQLKILELTGGKIATCFDSSMGFRHGPKSFVDADTLIVVFVSNNAYTRQYDMDIIAELRNDSVARRLYTVAAHDVGDFVFPCGDDLPDAYMALADVMTAQYISTYSAVRVENDVDNPSASGTVNRVVKGVIIHEYEA